MDPVMRRDLGFIFESGSYLNMVISNIANYVEDKKN
jgi:hypothetical protein